MLPLPLLAAPPAVRHPAEWEDQANVWMRWSTYDPARGQSVHRVQRDIVRALENRAGVVMLVSDAKEERAARKFLGDPSHVEYLPTTGSEIWMRDFGPTFVETPKSETIAAYRFDFWSYARKSDALATVEDATDLAAARTRELPLLTSKMVSEGGNRESNGRGTALMTWAVESRRNPGWSRARIEAEHRRVSGYERIVWVPNGGAEDDLTFDGPLPGNVYTCVTTGGHIDNVARWAADGRTVLIPEVTPTEASRSPISAISRQRFDAAAKAVRAQGFPVIRVPSPDLPLVTLKPGDGTYDFIAGLKYKRPFPKGRAVKVVPAGSYLNYIVCNGLVLSSSFGGPKDARMTAVLRKAFPKYDVVAIPSMPLALGGGGIHCITQPEWR